MQAMVLHAIGEKLRLEERPDPVPGPGQIGLRVEACGVCRTDLHVVDGELPDPRLPIIPGHEIVGIVEALGEGVTQPAIGDRVGVPWLGHTAAPGARTSATGRCSPATRAMAALPPMWWPTRRSHFR